MLVTHEFSDASVQAAFASCPTRHQPHLMRIRELIFEVAASLDLAGCIEETLKWGEPSYLPTKPRTGSTVRIGSFDAERVAMYFNCQTTLVERFRAMFGGELSYSKNRAVLFDVSEPLPENCIRTCARLALHYHLDKNGSQYNQTS